MDRYWWYWTRELRNSDKTFANQWFYFFDEKGEQVAVCGDQLTPEALGYSYDETPPTVMLQGIKPLAGAITLTSARQAYPRLLGAALTHAPEAQFRALSETLKSEPTSAALPKSISVPVRITIPIRENNIPGGHYFGLALRFGTATAVIGGFGIFTSHAHAGEITAVGCLGADALQMLRDTPPARLEMVYGPVTYYRSATPATMARPTPLKGVSWTALRMETMRANLPVNLQ